MSAVHDDAIRILDEADERIRRGCGLLRSLAPGAREATPLAAVGRRLLTDDAPVELAFGFARALAAIADAQCRNFPENLFWDWEFLATCLLARAASGLPSLSRTQSLIIELEEAFGKHSDVRFRYTHDFAYGFDWARWVAKDPAARASVGPFDDRFLEHLLSRGRELLALILEDDEMYPRLPSGEDRNPFGFRRDPASEETLHRELVKRRLVPIEAWRYDAIPRWNQPFRELRERIAESLGLRPTARGSIEEE